MKAKTLGLSTISILALAVAGCETEVPPFNPHQLQTTERNDARTVRSEPMPPLPTTLESPYLLGTMRGGRTPTPAAKPTTGPALGIEPVVRMTLQEIVQRAAVNNLDVRAAGYDPAVRETAVVEEEGKFDPTFFSQFQYQHQSQPTGGTLVDENISGVLTEETLFAQVTETTTIATGIRQQLDSGGQAEFRWEEAYTKLAPEEQVIGPYWTNNIVLEIQQPLLQGFGNEVTRARITLARYEQRISQLDFRKTLEQNLADLEKAYWQLVVAERNVWIQEALLQQTIDTASLLAKRGAQDVTRVQTSQANAAVESRRAVLIRAKSDVRDLSDQIKQLMNDPDYPISANTLLLPGTAAIEDPIHFDLADQIDTALLNRYELAQELLRIDEAATRMQVAKNNLLPKFNVVGSVGDIGLGGTGGDALAQIDAYPHTTWKVGLQLEVPIGNRSPRAIYQRQLLLRQQEIDKYRSLIERVSLEVKTALRQVHTTWDEMVTTRQARFATADSLRAIQLREENNEPLTPTFVQLKLDTQERLANAAKAESEAIGNYNNAVASLERAKGTLLKYDNVLMAEDPTTPFMAAEKK